MMNTYPTSIPDELPPSLSPLHFPLYPVWLTYVLLGVNILMFIPTWLWGNTVYAFGGLIPEAVLHYGEWWRLLTAGFIHGNLTHLAFNMYALYSLGQLTERIFGPIRFALIYLLALVGGSAVVILFNAPRTLTIGASGAILGLLGALIAYFWRHQDRLLKGRQQFSRLLTTALLNLAVGLLPQVSLWGHFGGIVAGLAVGLLIYPQYTLIQQPFLHLERHPIGKREGLGGLIVAGACLLVLLLAFWLRR